MHTVPFEGSVGLVNLLTTTRIIRKGFSTTLCLYGPGVLMAAAGRGFPDVGAEGFPGNLSMNKQLDTIMNEGGTIHACRFAMVALYGMRESDIMEGVKPFHPLDVLDGLIDHWRDGGWSHYLSSAYEYSIYFCYFSGASKRDKHRMWMFFGE